MRDVRTFLKASEGENQARRNYVPKRTEEKKGAWSAGRGFVTATVARLEFGG